MRAEKEMHLLLVIANAKERLKIYKKARHTNMGGKGWVGEEIRRYKTILTVCKHELARIRGWDKVVVPRRHKEYKCVFVCSCGHDVIDNFCPRCGRKILWEK